MIDGHNSSDSNVLLNIASCVLFSLAWLLKSVSTQFTIYVTFTKAYDILFHTLSFVSVCMVLVINWPKFKERVVKIKAQWKKKRKK